MAHDYTYRVIKTELSKQALLNWRMNLQDTRLYDLCKPSPDQFREAIEDLYRLAISLPISNAKTRPSGLIALESRHLSVLLIHE